jgi:hydrogenase maturation protease
MQDLRSQLQSCFQDGACLLGLGNPDYGDDGFGVRLAEALLNAGRPNVIVAGTAPERHLPSALERHPAHVIFADAVEFGGAAGSVIFLNADEIVARFPQISTHKLSLGLLAKYAQADGKTRCWLLGAQPDSLKPGGELTPAMRKTVLLLTQMITRANGESL